MTDEDLLAGLRGQEPSAIEELLRRFEAPLYRFFLLSHGDHHLAEDQCGDTFVALVSAVRRLRGGAESLRPFVFGIARNILRRSLRRNRFRPMPLEYAPDIADHRAGPLRSLADNEALHRAMRFIEALDDPVRTVLILRYVEDLTMDEIAKALDMPSNTVKSHIHRAHKRLRAQIAASESDKKLDDSHE